MPDDYLEAEFGAASGSGGDDFFSALTRATPHGLASPEEAIRMVPRHVPWTNYRAIGKTAAEARMLCQHMKDLDNAGAYAAELEVVPHNLATFLSSRTRMILISLGSGSGCDTQFHC